MLTENIAGVVHAYDITDNRPETLTAETSNTPTLVFIHGWLLSRTYWQPLVKALSSHYRCLTYDLRGFGESITDTSSPARQAKPLSLPAGRTLNDTGISDTESYTVSAYSLAAYAQDLEALLDTLGIEQAWVLGHSLGGSIALWSAYLFPARIKGVVCINAGGGIYIPKEFEKFRAAGQQMVKFRPSWLQKIPLMPRIFSRAMVRQPLGMTWGKQRIQDFVRADRQAAEGALLETTTEAEVHLLPQVMRQINQPVHFITATEDTIMPPRYVRYLASFHPHFQAAGEKNASVSEIPNCGHMAMLEQTQAVAQVIRAVIPSSCAGAHRPLSDSTERKETKH